MSRDTTVIAFRQPEAIDDPLTELAREGARRMLAQVLIAEADCLYRHVEGLEIAGWPRPHRAKSRWSRSCATRIAEPVAPGTIVRQVFSYVSSSRMLAAAMSTPSPLNLLFVAVEEHGRVTIGRKINISDSGIQTK